MTFDELERLAKAATPGPWRHDTRMVLDAREDAVAMVNLARGPDDALADARFISFWAMTARICSSRDGSRALASARLAHSREQ